MQRSSIFLNRGRKRVPLIRNVTTEDWDKFIIHACDGLTENGRDFSYGTDEFSVVVFNYNQRPLYTLTLESDNGN